jgi:tetratricopeptide (TPR) repeat protein
LYDDAAITADKIHQAYVSTEGANSKNALHWMYEAAGHHHAAGAFEKCLQVGHQVIAQIDAAELDYPEVKLNALNAIIKCHIEKFENDQAYQYMNVAQALMESGQIKDHETLGRTYNSFAVITRRQHDFERSGKYYQLSLMNVAKSLGKDNTAYATILNGFGRMYMLQGKYDLAKPYLEESMQRVAAFDPDSHVLARNMSYYAKYLFNTGEQLAAIEILDEAKQIAQKRKHQFTLMTIEDLRYLYNGLMGNWMAALQASLDRIDLAYEMYGYSHSRVSLYVHELAGILSSLGQHEWAENYWLKNIERYSGDQNQHQSDLANTYAYMTLNALNTGVQHDAMKYVQLMQNHIDELLEKRPDNLPITGIATLLFEPGSIEVLSSDQDDDFSNMTLQALAAQQLGSLVQAQCELTPKVLQSVDMVVKQLFLETCATVSAEAATKLIDLQQSLSAMAGQFDALTEQQVRQTLAAIKK